MNLLEVCAIKSNLEFFTSLFRRKNLSRKKRRQEASPLPRPDHFVVAMEGIQNDPERISI